MEKTYKITEKNLVRDEDTLRGGRWEGGCGEGCKATTLEKNPPN